MGSGNIRNRYIGVWQYQRVDTTCTINNNTSSYILEHSCLLGLIGISSWNHGSQFCPYIKETLRLAARFEHAQGIRSCAPLQIDFRKPEKYDERVDLQINIIKIPSIWMTYQPHIMKHDTELSSPMGHNRQPEASSIQHHHYCPHATTVIHHYNQLEAYQLQHERCFRGHECGQLLLHTFTNQSTHDWINWKEICSFTSPAKASK